MVAWKNQREHYRERRYTWPAFWTTRDRLSFLFPGALHHFDGSRASLLVPASSHRQRVSSGIQRNVDES